MILYTNPYTRKYYGSDCVWTIYTIRNDFPYWKYWMYCTLIEAYKLKSLVYSRIVDVFNCEFKCVWVARYVFESQIPPLYFFVYVFVLDWRAHFALNIWSGGMEVYRIVMRELAHRVGNVRSDMRYSRCLSHVLEWINTCMKIIPCNWKQQLCRSIIW